MQPATIKARRQLIKKVVKIRRRKPVTGLCSLSFTSAEKPASRKKAKKRVIEKLLPAAPKVVRTCSNIDSRLAESLLMDVKAIFKMKKAVQLRSQTILDALNADKKKPWATFHNGNPIGPRQLALLLKQFGIGPRDIRFSGSAYKGYKREWFLGADRGAN